MRRVRRRGMVTASAGSGLVASLESGGLTGELDVGVAAGAVGSVDDGGGLEKPDPVRCREFGGVSCREERGGVEVVRREDREAARVVPVGPFLESV